LRRIAASLERMTNEPSTTGVVSKSEENTQRLTHPYDPAYRYIPKKWLG
jgi:hypothetical protein